MKHIINSDQRGLKFHLGQLQKILGAGRHSSSDFWGTTIEIYNTSEEFLPAQKLDILLDNSELQQALQIVDVADDEICMVFENEGRNFKQVLGAGRHAFWKTATKLNFQNYKLGDVWVPDTINSQLLQNALLVPHILLCEVASCEKTLLIVNGEYQKTLEPGKYYFWKSQISINTVAFDTRQLQLDLAGQEIMTKDKVNLRMNVVCQYRITDPHKLHFTISDYKAQLYIVLQLILREYVGNLNLDELLEQKDQIGSYVLGRLRERAPDWGLEFGAAGIKDIILPGEIKTILEQVLQAEKKAQANIIRRREETASTRSLLNTAKVMEENPLLFKLKEMEHVETISQNITQLNLNSPEPLGDQLRRLFSAQSPKQP